MARKALTPTGLALVQALEEWIPLAIRQTQAPRCRIGLSGGADSLALTAAFAWARDHRQGPLTGCEITARVIDHGLQSNSTMVARQAASQAEALGIEADVVPVTVAQGRGGVEAAAREARLSALVEGDPALVVLAHTLDDQAETVLLGLARGSGTRSLSGMAAIAGSIVRPFLGLRRADTERACQEWGLSWWDDPMNLNPAYTRSRVRLAMSTLEETLGPRFAESLARSAHLCRQDADHLEDLALSLGLHVNDSLLVGDLEPLHPALRHRVLLAWLRCHCQAQDVDRDNVIAVDALITSWRGQKSISVPGGKVLRRGGSLVVQSVYEQS